MCQNDIHSFLTDLSDRFITVESKVEQLIRATDCLQATMAEVNEQIGRQPRSKAYYTPLEVAELVGKAPFTVREWCRLGRINATKRRTGRGDTDEWEISNEEIERYRNHGLLPRPTEY